MRITKAELQAENDRLANRNLQLTLENTRLVDELAVWKSVAQRPDTALITVQRLAEATCALAQRNSQ